MKSRGCADISHKGDVLSSIHVLTFWLYLCEIMSSLDATCAIVDHKNSKLSACFTSDSTKAQSTATAKNPSTKRIRAWYTFCMVQTHWKQSAKMSRLDTAATSTTIEPSILPRQADSERQGSKRFSTTEKDEITPKRKTKAPKDRSTKIERPATRNHTQPWCRLSPCSISMKNPSTRCHVDAAISGRSC